MQDSPKDNQHLRVMSKLRVDTRPSVMFEGLQSPRMTSSLAPMSPRASAFASGAARPSTVEDGLLAMSAQLEDRQEARRRMAPGGKVLQDNGATSDDGRQEQDYQQQRERLLSLFSPSSSVSGGMSLSGAADGDPNLPPSERYWRERASLMGGRCSVMDHAARVRDRRQVQADLRAWVEDVLDGHQMQQEQQQQFEDAMQQEPQQRPLSARADTRWSDLPSDLYYKLTGQRPPPTAADAQAGKKQHRRRPSTRPRQSVRHSMRNAQQLIELLAQQQQQQHTIDFKPHLPQQQVQQQWTQQDEGRDASEGITSSVADGNGGLYLTPRTAQEFGDGLRQQMQQKVDAEVQQQLQQVTQQWQQANLEDQQLLQQLQQEHQMMQQQLADAHQQIAALTSGSSVYTSAVAPGRRVTGLAPGSSAELQQHELLTAPAPDVQVLTFLDPDEQQGSVSDQEEADAGLETLSLRQLVQPSEGQQTAGDGKDSKHSTKPMGQAGAVEQQSKGSPRRAAAAAPAGDGDAAKRAAPRSAARSTPSKAASSNSKPSTPVPATVSKTPRRPGTGSAAADSSKGSEGGQQQALLLRLQHAEEVMELLQRGLQASVTSKQQLTEQLEAAQAQLKQQLQAQQHVGEPPEQQQQGGQQQQAGSGTCSGDAQLVTQLQRQVAQLQEQLATTQQRLTDAQQSARDTSQQLQQQQELQEDWQLRYQQQQAVLQGLEAQLQNAQQQQQRQLIEHAAVDDGNSSAEQPSTHTAAEQNGVDSPTSTCDQAHQCEQCQLLESQVRELQAQLKLAGKDKHRALADQAAAAEASPGRGSLDSSRQRPASAAAAAAAGLSPREQRPRGQPFAMKTILCPPPPPEVVAIHTLVAVAGAGSAQPQQGARSVAKAISTGLMSLRGSVDTVIGSDLGKPSESMPLAGLHRMQPVSSRPVNNNVAVNSMTPAVPPAVGPSAIPEAAGDRGAAFLQLVGECLTSRTGSASMLTSRQGAADAEAGADDDMSGYSSLQLKGRSCSPRHQAKAARPATADRGHKVPAAADAISDGDISSMLHAALSPRRPQTAAFVLSKHAGLSQPPQSGWGGQWHSAVVGQHRSEPIDNRGTAATEAVNAAEHLLAGALTSRQLASAGGRQKLKQVPRLNLSRVEAPV